MNQVIEKSKDGVILRGRVKWIKRHSITGELIEESGWKNNLIMLSADRGFDLILDRLAGTNTYTLNVTHGDIGTGSTTPAVTDTTLTTPSVRASLSGSTISGGTVSLQFLFTDAALANGTYYEFGTFIDGTSTISTGRIFNHALFTSALVKTTLQDITIQVDFGFSQ